MTERGPKHDDMGVDWDADAIRASKAPYPYTDSSFFNYFKDLVKPYDRVLEVGCQIASWIWAWWGLEPTIQYEGLDWSEVALKIAEKRYGPGGTDLGKHLPAKFYLMDAREMDFWEEYDIVFCFPPGSLINTDEGYHLIEKEPKSALTHEGVYRRVTQNFERFYEGPLINLKVTGSNEELRLTPEHRILLVRKEKVIYPCKQRRSKSRLDEEWVSAKNVEVGDLAVLVFDTSVQEPPVFDLMQIADNCASTEKFNRVLKLRECGLSYYAISAETGVPVKTAQQWHDGIYHARGTTKEIDGDRFTLSSGGLSLVLPRILSVNEDVMRLLGYFASDGSIELRKSSTKAFFYFGEEERAFSEDLVNIIEGLFGLKPILRYSKGCLVLTVSSKAFALFLEEAFGRHKGAALKIPPWIMKTSENLQKEFIKGFWRGDGSVLKSGFSICTASRHAAYQLRDLLLRLGVFSSIYRVETGGWIRGRRIKPGERYDLHVTGEGVSKFSEIVGFDHPFVESRQRTYSQVFLSKSRVYLPIRALSSSMYSGLVHNLDIENDHSYTTTIATVHNCHTFYQHTNIETKRFVAPAVFRALKPGGLHIIQENTSYESDGTWFEEGWIKFFTQFGFKLVRLKTFGDGGSGFVFRR